MTIVWKWSLNWNANAQVWSNGTATNVTWVDWKQNWAWSFNWSNSWIDIINYSASNNLTSFSIWWLIKINSFNTNQMPFSKNWKWFNIRSTWIIEADVKFSTTAAHTTTTNTISIWKWYYIEFVFNWSNIDIYINWQICLYSTKINWVWSITNDNTKNWLLGRYDGTWYFLNGVIDEVVLNNIPLTSAEIKNKALYYNWFI